MDRHAPRRAGAAAADAQRAAPAALACAASLALAACAPAGLSPADRAELDNMWRVSLVPKSTSGQMVTAFTDFCLDAPRPEIEAVLRRADYVPLPERTAGARGWVVDDRRPAVAVSDSMCVVRARSRSGQTAAFANLVKARFPNARPLDPGDLGADIEAAWQISRAGIVATERRRDIDFFIYSLIYYTPEGL
jgi:hypothetical protein